MLFVKMGRFYSEKRIFATSFTCLPQTGFDRKNRDKNGKVCLLDMNVRSYKTSLH